MKARPWRVRQQFVDRGPATQRWAQAYQALLTWTVDRPSQPATNLTRTHDAQEATYAPGSVCTSLDPAPSPEPGA